MKFKLSKLILTHLVIDTSYALLGGKRKIGLHHPVVIGWFLCKYFSYQTPFVLPEIEDRIAFCVFADAIVKVRLRIKMIRPAAAFRRVVGDEGTDRTASAALRLRRLLCEGRLVAEAPG